MKKNVVPFDSNADDRFARILPTDLSEAEQGSLVRLALKVLEARHQPGQCVDSPQTTRKFLRLRLAARENEVFGALFLDNRHRIVRVEDLFQGTIDGAAVYPRVVVQRALTYNATALVFYHNHPSGTPEPSDADQRITQKLRDALSLVDVRVLDHIVVGVEGAVSLAERGMI